MKERGTEHGTGKELSLTHPARIVSTPVVAISGGPTFLSPSLTYLSHTYNSSADRPPVYSRVGIRSRLQTPPVQCCEPSRKGVS